MGRRATAFAAAVATCVLAGCGNHRTPPPDLLAVRPPHGSAQASFPSLGLRFRRPANWQLKPGAAPQIATVASGRAVIALWRYPRREPLPRTRAALDVARRSLIAAARARDRRLRVDSSGVTRVRGVPAIVLVANERIAGRRRKVRSVHLFARSAELVVDAYAPPNQFRPLDAAARGLVRSLRIGAPRRS